MINAFVHLFTVFLLRFFFDLYEGKVYNERAKLETKNFTLNVELGRLLEAKQREDEAIIAYERAVIIKL